MRLFLCLFYNRPLVFERVNSRKMTKKIQGLYAITDQNMIAPKKFTSRVRQALEGGANIIQYRNKSQHHELRLEQAASLVALCAEFGALSIINDDIELSKLVDADGLHIGSDDDDLSYARSELGPEKIIGVSCYASLGLANQAIAGSADYVAFGSIFASSTKPQAPVASLDILRQATQELSVPVVAIGGINLGNLSDVVATGVDSVAIISGIFASDDANVAAQSFAKAFV